MLITKEYLAKYITVDTATGKITRNNGRSCTAGVYEKGLREPRIGLEGAMIRVSVIVYAWEKGSCDLRQTFIHLNHNDQDCSFHNLKLIPYRDKSHGNLISAGSLLMAVPRGKKGKGVTYQEGKKRYLVQLQNKILGIKIKKYFKSYSNAVAFNRKIREDALEELKTFIKD